MPIIISLVTSGWFVIFVRWHLLLKNSKIFIPKKDSLLIFFSGFALAVIPGKAGDLIKSQLLKTKFGIPRSKTVPLVILEQLYTVIGLVFLSFFGIWYFELGMYVIGFFIAFFVRSPLSTQSIEKPNDQTTFAAIKEAFKNKSFILLTSGFFVCGFHITLVGTHVPKYVIDRGLESWTAATILSLIGLFNIFGSLTSGYLSSIMSKKIILSSIYFLRGVSIVFFIFLPPSNISAFIFGASFGFLWLSTVPATSGIVAHIFGTKYLGILYGIVFLSHQIGSFFGAYLGGLFSDLYGSFNYCL